MEEFFNKVAGLISSGLSGGATLLGEGIDKVGNSDIWHRMKSFLDSPDGKMDAYGILGILAMGLIGVSFMGTGIVGLICTAALMVAGGMIGRDWGKGGSFFGGGSASAAPVYGAGLSRPAPGMMMQPAVGASPAMAQTGGFVQTQTGQIVPATQTGYAAPAFESLPGVPQVASGVSVWIATDNHGHGHYGPPCPPNRYVAPRAPAETFYTAAHPTYTYTPATAPNEHYTTPGTANNSYNPATSQTAYTTSGTAHNSYKPANPPRVNYTTPATHPNTSYRGVSGAHVTGGHNR